MKTQERDGLPVRDAKKSIFLTISPVDIQKAKRRMPDNCPIARACKRDLGAVKAEIHRARAYLRFNSHYEKYIVPVNLRTELVAFDKGGAFQPGDYVLHKMQPHRANDYKRKRKTGPHETKKRKIYHVLDIATSRPHA